MYFSTVRLVIFSLLTISSCHRSFSEEYVKTEHQQLNCSWPVFVNNSSYVFILGLFVGQRYLVARHSQTLSEPAMFRAAILLSQAYNITVNGKKFAYRIEDTSGSDGIEALDRTCLAINESEVLGIVGPEYSVEAKTIAGFSNRAGLPVIGYSTTDPALSNRHAYRTFYRLPPSDVVTAQALLKLFQMYNWTSTNVIYQSDNYGEGGLKALTAEFKNEITIPSTIKYDFSRNAIDDLQHQLEKSPSRIVLVWANPMVTTKIIDLALAVGNIMAPSFLWILLASDSTIKITDYPHVDQLAGMLMLRLWIPSSSDIQIDTGLLNDAIAIWKEYDCHNYPSDPRKIDVFALYAFDAAWLLILAIKDLCERNSSTCLSWKNASRCFNSQLLNPDQRHRILQTMNFTGVSGRVQFRSNTTDRIEGTGIYYVIDNVQPDTDRLRVVKVLTLNGTTMNNSRWSVPQWIRSDRSIHWPNGQSEAPCDYALLNNITLEIAVYMSPPFLMTKSDRNENLQLQGYIHDLLQSLQKRMKFNYTYTVAPMSASYDELVECVQNGTYKMVMADLAITSSRSLKIDFSHPIYDNILRLVTRKSPKTMVSPFAFFEPFSYQLWLLVGGVIYCLSALLIAGYEYYGQEGEQLEESSGNIRQHGKLSTIFRSLYHTIGALVQRGSELQPKTFFGCLQTVVVWLMSIVLIALLTSNLTTYFSAKYELSLIQSIADLQMCRKVPCNRIGIIERSQHSEYFIKEVMNGFPSNYHPLKHPTECYTKLLNYEIDVALADSSSADYYTQTLDYCELQATDVPFGRIYFGAAIPHQWPYKRDLDNNIIKLKESDEIDQLLSKWFQKKDCNRESDDYGDGLRILEVRGLFYIFAAMTGINLLAFLSKKLYTAYIKRRLSKNAVFITAANDALEEETELASKRIQVSQLPVGTLVTPLSVYEDRSKLVDDPETHKPYDENLESSRF